MIKSVAALVIAALAFKQADQHFFDGRYADAAMVVARSIAASFGL
jgi:hypothetical protein